MSTVDTDTIPLGRLRKHSSKCVTAWINAPSPFNIPKYGWPTEAPPGTVEKVLVIMARANRSEELFHPFDAKIDGDTRPLLFYLAKWEEREEARNKVGV